MQKVFIQNALPWTADPRLTGAYWIWVRGIPAGKREQNQKVVEEAGRIDTAGKESASGAVPLFILIYHNYCSLSDNFHEGT